MITIQTLQGTGVIKIESNPSSADVYLDGEYYGKTPITVKDVEMGLHTYTLKCPGHPDYTSSMNVVAGQLCYSKYDFTNYSVEESCPPIQLSGMSETSVGTKITGLGTVPAIQTLQVPAPIPGYIIISQSTAMWVLAGALVAILLVNYIGKRS